MKRVCARTVPIIGAIAAIFIWLAHQGPLVVDTHCVTKALKLTDNVKNAEIRVLVQQPLLNTWPPLLHQNFIWNKI